MIKMMVRILIMMMLQGAASSEQLSLSLSHYTTHDHPITQQTNSPSVSIYSQRHILQSLTTILHGQDEVEPKRVITCRPKLQPTVTKSSQAQPPSLNSQNGILPRSLDASLGIIISAASWWGRRVSE